MPTGYPADVQAGKITTLDQFAWHCARAFGACITMRDDSQSAAIPERFEPETSHYDEQITLALTEQERLQKMTDLEAEQAASDEFHQRILENQRYLAEKAEHRARYEAMLAKVRAWRCDKEIDGLRKFMVEQLESSIQFDCGDYEPPVVKKLAGPEWLKRRLSDAAARLARSKVEREKEIQRVAGRNAWLAQLRADLVTQ
jgi:hypothetical protein